MPDGRFVIICDHALNRVPAELNDLGLPEAELRRHIAWDIGAAGVAAELSRIFNAPLVMSEVSRLVIDCNRHLDAADLIPGQSDGTVIPGNLNISDDERSRRIRSWFDSYHGAVESVLEERLARRLETVLLSIHSMTDCLGGVPRPWQIAISSHDDRTFAQPVLEALRKPGDIVVGDNEPYNLDPAIDFSTPFHAMRRGIGYLQVEFRQDEIAEAQGQIAWARRFAAAVSTVLT